MPAKPPDPRDILHLLVAARDAEPTGPDYQVYERAIDALSQHSVVLAVRGLALDEIARKGQTL